MRVFITRKIPDTAIKMLKEASIQVEIWEHEDPPSSEILTEKMKDVDGMITMLSDNIDRNLLSPSKNLKIIANYAVGYNNIDLNAAKELGIKVTNTPNVLTNATADIAFMLMISLMRNLPVATQTVKDGRWKTWAPTGPLLGVELTGKTVGIFGSGRIGSAFATRCHHGFDMQILYTSNSRNETLEKECRATRVTFDDLLLNSDVLSLHAPLTDQTRGLFNKNAFSQMKKSAFFINTARGEIHNEEELILALQNGEIAGAGLDVTNPEPIKIDSPLLSMSNVIITPHIGSATLETRGEMAILCAKNVIACFRGEKLLSEIRT